MTWRATSAVVLMALALGVPAAMAQETASYRGMRLAEALQTMQALGLRIVYSSAVVPSELVVAVEPRGATPRQQLDEMLAPHGLEVREGAGGTLQIVRAPLPPQRLPRDAHGSIAGRVLDAVSAVPLSHVLVRVDGHRLEALTDATGQFLLQRIPAGACRLLASAPGYAPARLAVAIAGGKRASVTLRLSPEARLHTEYVSVTEAPPYRSDRGVASEMSLDGNDLTGLHGSPTGDPVRVIQALPGVIAIDDFRSEFTVRGSPYRHVDFVVDGVSTHGLLHTAYGRGATGSITMLTPLLVERATLRTGAYPRRHGDRLGPELELSLREGSRAELTVRGAVATDQAALVAEGPIGDVESAGSARGSWLVSARQSFMEWPPERSSASRTAFGFWDAAAKFVFDVRPAQQLALTLVGGTSAVDHEDNLAPNELASGTNATSLFSLSWRSTLPAWVIRQQVSAVAQHHHNAEQGGRMSDRGRNGAFTYRADLSRPVAGGLLEAGARVQRIEIAQVPRLPETGGISGSAWVRSGFVHFVWAAAPSLTVSPGLRITSSTMVRGPAVSPWLLGEWSLRPGWSVIGSAGVSRQLPELIGVLGARSTDFRPERATHFELGIEQQLTRAVRWRATMYQRKEWDLLRSLDVHPRLERDVLVFPAGGAYSNALEGTSRGIELVVTGRSARGLSGWASYAYGRTLQTDVERGETYWADFDQRHTVNVSGVYRLARNARVGATFRAGSNFPVAGYFVETNGRLAVASARNQVRLPPYARLDLRADREFPYFGGRLNLFAEVQNALNRANRGLAIGSVDPLTGEARGFTDTLLGRRVSAGVAFVF